MLPLSMCSWYIGSKSAEILDYYQYCNCISSFVSFHTDAVLLLSLLINQIRNKAHMSIYNGIFPSITEIKAKSSKRVTDQWLFPVKSFEQLCLQLEITGFLLQCQRRDRRGRQTEGGTWLRKVLSSATRETFALAVPLKRELWTEQLPGLPMRLQAEPTTDIIWVL